MLLELKNITVHYDKVEAVKGVSLDVGEGDIVTVESPRAELKCQASLTDSIRPQVVQLYHGFEEASANLLTDCGSCDPITGSAPLRSSLCRIMISKS